MSQPINQSEIQGQAKPLFVDREDTTFAGFFVRMVAYSFDYFLIFCLLLTIKIPIAFMTMSDSAATILKNVLFTYNIFDIIYYILTVLYFIIFTSVTQTTPGKYLLKLRVVTENGQKPSFLTIVFRETVGRFLSAILCLGYLMVIVDKQKRGFHDFLSDTRVVYSCKVRKIIVTESKTVKKQTPAYGRQQLPQGYAQRPAQPYGQTPYNQNSQYAYRQNTPGMQNPYSAPNTPQYGQPDMQSRGAQQQYGQPGSQNNGVTPPQYGQPNMSDRGAAPQIIRQDSPQIYRVAPEVVKQGEPQSYAEKLQDASMQYDQNATEQLQQYRQSFVEEQNTETDPQ